MMLCVLPTALAGGSAPDPADSSVNDKPTASKDELYQYGLQTVGLGQQFPEAPMGYPFQTAAVPASPNSRTIANSPTAPPGGFNGSGEGSQPGLQSTTYGGYGGKRYPEYSRQHGVSYQGPPGASAGALPACCGQGQPCCLSNWPC